MFIFVILPLSDTSYSEAFWIPGKISNFEPVARSYYNHPFRQELYGRFVFAVLRFEADASLGETKLG
jgi:hypothetical protein